MKKHPSGASYEWKGESLSTVRPEDLRHVSYEYYNKGWTRFFKYTKGIDMIISKHSVIYRNGKKDKLIIKLYKEETILCLNMQQIFN